MVEHPQVGVVHGARPGGQGGQVRRLALRELTLGEVVSHSAAHSPFCRGCWRGETSALHSPGTPEKFRLGQEILMGPLPGQQQQPPGAPPPPCLGPPGAAPGCPMPAGDPVLRLSSVWSLPRRSVMPLGRGCPGYTRSQGRESGGKGRRGNGAQPPPSGVEE